MEGDNPQKEAPTDLRILLAELEAKRKEGGKDHQRAILAESLREMARQTLRDTVNGTGIANRAFETESGSVKFIDASSLPTEIQKVIPRQDSDASRYYYQVHSNGQTWYFDSEGMELKANLN